MLRHRVLEANGIGIHFAEEGNGPLVVLLHGFPEFWYAWRRQIPALAARGFRVVAPDLRGYGSSSRPRGTRAYRMDALVGDVAGLIRGLGQTEAVLVGHDWGGVIAWQAAMEPGFPVRRLVVLNAPHPVAFRRELRRPSSQLLRSWYAGMFQIPALPEALLRAGNFALLRRALRAGPARTREEMRRYIEAFSTRGALTAALSYYRAAVRHPPRRPRPIHVPTLLLWGERDRFLVPELASGLEGWVSDLRVQRLPNASHWLHHEEPETVSTAIAEAAA